MQSLSKKIVNQNNSKIFNRNVNKTLKLVPFNTKKNIVGNRRYFPSTLQEWKNSIYVFNKNTLKNLPSNNININKLIRGYFYSYINRRVLNFKLDYFLRRRFKNKAVPTRRLSSLNRIIVSKPEIKHTNSRVVINLYAYNRERLVLLKKIKQINFNYIVSKLRIAKMFASIQNKEQLYEKISRRKDYNIKAIMLLLSKKLVLLRRYKFKLNLNKYKYEKNLLSKLSTYIERYFHKKIDYNIINLKSIAFNSDILTEILVSKFSPRARHKRKIWVKPINRINSILSKVIIPNTMKDRRRESNINVNSVENKYKNSNLNHIITNTTTTGDSLNKILNTLYYNAKASTLRKNNASLYSEGIQKNNNSENLSIVDTVFTNIKYKNIGGIRLRVKGRLSRRYRADRAIYIVKWKGGLKNIDSSFKRLSSNNLRGFVKANIESSLQTSKRHIGAFAIKGWIGGK